MNNWYFIHYSNPHKPKLLLLHGLTSDAEVLKPMANILKKYFEIYIPAFPGIGETPAENLKSIPDLAQRLYEFGQLHKIFPCHVFGTSMGGTVSLLLASKYPKIFNQILVHDPPWRKTSIHMGLFQEFELIVSKIVAAYPQLLKNRSHVKFLLKIAAVLKPDLAVLIRKYETRIIRILIDTDIPTTLNLLKNLRDSDFGSDYQKIKQPVTILCAEADQVVFPPETKLLGKSLKHPKIISIKDGDHDLVLDMPQKTADLILSVCLPQNKT